MRFVWQKEIQQNLKVLITRLGYHQQIERRSGEISYIKRLSGSGYPRFHLYINEREDGLEFSLHLDEKKPSYQGQTAHSGQYEGDLVMNEVARIKSQLGS